MPLPPRRCEAMASSQNSSLPVSSRLLAIQGYRMIALPGLVHRHFLIQLQLLGEVVKVG